MNHEALRSRLQELIDGAHEGSVEVAEAAADLLAHELSPMVLWPKQRLVLVVEHDTLGDEYLAPLIAPALAEMNLEDPWGRLMEYRARNGVRITIERSDDAVIPVEKGSRFCWHETDGSLELNCYHIRPGERCPACNKPHEEIQP